MILYQPKFKLLRNEYGNPLLSLSVIEKKILTPHYDKLNDKLFLIRLKLAVSLLDEKTNSEIYGHLSELDAQIKNDFIANDKEQLKMFIGMAFTNLDISYQDNKPNNFPSFVFIENDTTETINTFINSLKTIGYYNK